LLVRPSYVLGGRAMEIAHSDAELLDFVNQAIKVNPEHPILIDSYMAGVEVELDAICNKEMVLIPGIMEQIERSGVHSGDSIAVYPPQTLSAAVKQRIVEITIKISKALNVIGLMNIQFLVYEDKVYVIEVNPRSSRTVPFMSKVTSIPMANVATKIILGKQLEDLGYSHGLFPEEQQVSVKVPLFSFAKLSQVDVVLGPEMKSTGEVMGRDPSYIKALYKGLVGSGMKLPSGGKILASIAEKDKPEALEPLRELAQLGYEILATPGTADWIINAGVPVASSVDLGVNSSFDLHNLMQKGEIRMVINTSTRGKIPSRDGFRLRREAVENGVLCITSIDTVQALIDIWKTGIHLHPEQLEPYRMRWI
jgi:carbamoyl-phosphate synthase large subunit